MSGGVGEPESVLANPQFKPVFIIGMHRSGTTFLENLLAGTKQFNVVTAYHAIRYDEIVENHRHGRTKEAKTKLAEEFRAKGISDRIFDGVPVTVDSPVEYGWIINTRPSQFRRSNLSISPKTLPGFLELCRRMQAVGEPGKPLLLKNPWDATAFAYIKQVMPQSKLLFIHRHPLSVIHSQIQALRSVRDTENPSLALFSEPYAASLRSPWRRAVAHFWTSERLGMPRRTAAYQTALAISYYLKNVSAVPKQDCLTIRYEDLCADPDSTMRTIGNFLGLVFPQKNYREMVKRRTSQPSPDAQRAFHRVGRSRLDPYLKMFSYSFESADVR